MKLFVAAALFFSAVSAFSINGKEELIKKSLEKKILNSDRMSRLTFATSAWKSQFQALEEPKSTNLRDLEHTLSMGLSGRTWFHSGSLQTTSTSPPTPCPTPSCTTSSGWSLRWLEDLTLES